MGMIKTLFLSKVGSKFNRYSVLKSGLLNNLCCKIMAGEIINPQDIIFNGSVIATLRTGKSKHGPNLKTK